ncbi:MAG: chemotaxis protein CheW [Bacteroidales bacterium]|nr:chemotaxis protein CheW [Bacteroidales bacterium]
MDVVNVLEVLEQQQITRVPKVPEHIMGIINFRGEILPVINTRIKFCLPTIDDESKNYIIVYELSRKDETYIVSATADGVEDVIEIDPAEIKPVPEMGLGFDAKFIAGVIRRDEKFILLLKPERVFSSADSEAVKLTETLTQ